MHEKVKLSVFDIRAREILRDERFVRDDKKKLSVLYRRMSQLEDRLDNWGGNGNSNWVRSELSALMWIEELLIESNHDHTLKQALERVRLAHSKAKKEP